GEAFAVTARATFLCLCKETWRKKAHSACTPGALHRVRGAGGTTEGASCPRGKRRTSMCGALYQVRVLSAAPAAPEGPRRSTSTATARNHSSKSRASAHANPVGAAEAASSCLAVASALVGAASAASLPTRCRFGTALSQARCTSWGRPRGHGRSHTRHAADSVLRGLVTVDLVLRQQLAQLRDRSAPH